MKTAPWFFLLFIVLLNAGCSKSADKNSPKPVGKACRLLTRRAATQKPDGTVVQLRLSLSRSYTASGVLLRETLDSLKPSGTLVTMLREFDATGQPARTTETHPSEGISQTEQFTFEGGRLTRSVMTGSTAYTRTYAYDAAGRLSKVLTDYASQPDLTEEYRYDANGRQTLLTRYLTAQPTAEQFRIATEYTPAGIKQKETTYENTQVVRVSTYNAQGLLASDAFRADPYSGKITTYAYAYDASQRVSKVSSSDGSYTAAYQYDTNGKPAAISYTGTVYPQPRVLEYSYDAAGNLTKTVFRSANASEGFNPVVNTYTYECL